jgi:lipid-A-disaccharide synthase
MFVILPFEQQFYARHNYQVEYAGHPLLDIINDRMNFTERNLFLEKNHLSDKPIVALLPGSRKMEIGKMLKEMLSVKSAFPQTQFVVAGAPAIPTRFYEQFIGETGAGLVSGQTYDLLRYASAALVTSGTATLETALMGVPQVVCYKGNPLSYLVARHLVRVKYISLVNLITDKPLVAELIQDKLNPNELEHELRKILEDEKSRSDIIKGYELLKKKLGGPGAAERTALMMVQYLQKN